MSDAFLHGDSDARKNAPIFRGVLGYFPDAIAAVANVSLTANRQHNGGEPMHWARNKSTDHADCIVRHLIKSGEMDDDGLRHTAKVAWRALALLQEELEAAHKLPLPRNAVNIPPPPNYNPDDVAFRKQAVRAMTRDAQLRGEYDPLGFRSDCLLPTIEYTRDEFASVTRQWPSLDAKAERDAKVAFDVAWDRKRDGLPADSVDIARGPLAGPEDKL